jgi:DNA-binding SARP family transcriptional activator
MSERPPTDRIGRPPHPREEKSPTRMSLRLLGGFELRAGTHVLSLPINAERLLALLAVRDRPQLRSTVASTLWMDTGEDRAAANLRTELWRLRRTAGTVVVGNGSYLALASDLTVDLFVLTSTAAAIVEADDMHDDMETRLLVDDLLPDWEEDWIWFERERLRQLRVHALEALCARRSACGRHAAAIDAGQAAVAAEPLRESAQRTLIEAHLAEGNVFEAKRQFDLYCRLLDESMGLRPAAVLAELVAAAVAVGPQRSAR